MPRIDPRSHQLGESFLLMSLSATIHLQKEYTTLSTNAESENVPLVVIGREALVRIGEPQFKTYYAEMSRSSVLTDRYARADQLYWFTWASR